MKRLFILSTIASLLATMLAPSWAGTINTTKSNTFREACNGKPDGASVTVERKKMTCQAGIAVSDDGGPQGPKKPTK